MGCVSSGGDDQASRGGRKGGPPTPVAHPDPLVRKRFAYAAIATVLSDAELAHTRHKTLQRAKLKLK